MKSLEGKKIFVTGGSRGIGASIVQVLAEKGAQVAFTYSSQEEAAQKVLASLPGTGHFHLKMNISSEESVTEGIDKVLAKFGEIDGIVNNAGITKDQLLLRMKTEDFDQVIHTNLKGTYLVTKGFLKSMLKSRKGSIVNITSVIGQTGNAGQANYAASKAGTEAFSKSTALEVASRGIRVNCVAPGFIATEMTEVLNEEQKKLILSKIPLDRIADPKEVAYAVSFLLSDESKYITGHTLSVNGGMYMG
ncbi:MAG: beta-ketoacyl-ACP reductase [Candidatus Jettenia caeni]|nr:MAG: beta-ketoacyl-ACP reductase [Candidatus Jettenia caeni]